MPISQDEAGVTRVLVTGGSGFVGRHVLAALADRSLEVHAAAIDEAVPEAALATWHRVDLLSPRDVRRLIEEVRPMHLLHLAWYAAPRLYWTSRENLRWLRATIDMAEAFFDTGGGRFVGAGSCAEYDWSSGHCDEAATATRPATLYGACKLSAGEIVGALARQSGASAAWARLFFLYGPHEHPDRLVSSVVRALLAGREAPCSDGGQVRDFLYIKDAAEALVATLLSDVSGPVNVASGTPTSVRALVSGVAHAIGRPDLIRFGALGSDPAPRLTAAVSRLADEVGWSPRYSPDNALAETIDWWRRP